MRFATWNVRSYYRAGSLQTAARKLAKHNLYLVAIKEVRWVEIDSQPAYNYTYFYGNGNANHHAFS
jgi:hypothetical protein